MREPEDADFKLGLARADGGVVAVAVGAVAGATYLGLNAKANVAAILAFRSGERPSTVMGRIAKGFSDDEIRAIALWLAAQEEKR